MTIKIAACWSLIILSSTIPLSVLGLIIMRIFTNTALSDNAANVIDGNTKIIGGGLISILSTIFGYYLKGRIDKLKNKQHDNRT